MVFIYVEKEMVNSFTWTLLWYLYILRRKWLTVLLEHTYGIYIVYDGYKLECTFKSNH